MVIRWKKLLICLAVSLGTGGLSALLTKDSMAQFEALRQPPLSPPGVVFPIVWSVLFLLMGISSYRIWVSPSPKRGEALVIYAIQLAVNFCWSLFFFNGQAYWFSFFWLLGLWVLILLMIRRFLPIDAPAGWLQLPYLLWVTFAGYLNLMIAILNP